MWRFIFSSILNFLVPPRAGQKIVERSTLEDLLVRRQPCAHIYNAALPYRDELVLHVVWELKYYDNPRATALAAGVLHEDLLALAADEVGTPLLIPIPMHRSRRKSRGHNQTETLCNAVMKELGSAYHYAPEALVRVRNTPPQQGLSKEKRLTNVYRSMQVTEPAVITGRVCVVVDDVSTTGATLAEAKRALLQGGAGRVYLVSLAAAF